jgi:hypothetical protein
MIQRLAEHSGACGSAAGGRSASNSGKPEIKVRSHPGGRTGALG